jgi:putative transferase (TIGR04331 family)
MNSERFLITTADERSWKFDRPVLFLGEWCRLYSRKEIWSGMDSEVASPFGLEKGKKERDRVYTQSLSVQLLKELTISLNEFHNTNHGERYWNILLGSWLWRYVNVAFNRYFCLEKALTENKISGTVIFNLPDYSLATSNSIDFQWALYDNVWNHVFYSRVLDFWRTEEFELVNLPDDERNSYVHDGNIKSERNIKNTIHNLWNWSCGKFSRKNDAFIMSSYLPFAAAVKLQLSLGQFPGFWDRPQLQNVPVNPELRSKFKIDLEGHTGFNLFVRKMLQEIIPTCYLEGYVQMLQQSQSLPWPRNPKFIFTSNGFDTDELFKVWTAEKVEQGHKYYVGQHGNLYGTWVYHGYTIPEYSATDKFISWGWKNDDPKICPAFIFKTVYRKPRTKIQNGGLLLIERCIYNRLATYDRHVKHSIYQQEQFKFVDILTKNIQESLTVRLSVHRLGNLSWSDEQRWKDFDSTIKLDSGMISVWNLINKNRLVVHSYDSTGLLETLSLNVPTLGFWNDLFDEVLPEALPYYKLLRDAGILAETPEDAAKLINMYWDRLGEWWFSQKVQEARITFCNKYAKTVDYPVRELKKILTNGIPSTN